MKVNHSPVYFILVSISFLLVIWGPPFPFYPAMPDVLQRSAGASLSGELNTKAFLQIAMWAIFFVLVLFGVLRHKTSRVLFINVDHHILKAWLFFTICCFISQAFSHGFMLSGFRIFQLVTLLVFLLFTFNAFREEPFKVFLLFISLNLSYNIIMYFFDPEQVVWSTNSGLYRLIGGWLFNKDYGLCALIVFCFSLAHIFFYKKDVIAFGLLILSIYGLILAGTRSYAVAAAIPVLTVFILSVSDRNLKVIINIVVAALFFNIIYFFPELNELLGRSHASLVSGSGRFQAWSLFWNEFWSNTNWLFGNGYAAGGRSIATKFYVGAFGNMHNMYLEVLVNFGIVGFIAFVSLIFTTLKVWLVCVRFLKERPEQGIILRNLIGWGFVFISLLISGLTANAFMEEFLISTFAFVLATFYVQHAYRHCMSLISK